MAVWESWARIESWLAANAPEMLESLNPGATDEAITAAEAEMSVALPADFKESCKIHDGQALDEMTLMPKGEFLSLERILDEWRVWKELLDSDTFEGAKSAPDEGVKNDWWNAAWIPITYDGSGNHDCLDLDPAQGGQVGQIITMWHDSSEREIMASSFAAWLEDFADGLYSGDYLVSEDSGGIAHKDDI